MSILKVHHLSKDFSINVGAKRTFTSRFFNAVSGVGKQKTIHPLSDVSFDLQKGESLGIIGKNGSGKSTLLKIIAGIYKANSGSVEVNGSLIFVAGMASGLKARLTARENIYLVGSLMSIQGKQMDELYNQIIDFAGLKEFSESKLYQFSSGMKSRLAFSTLLHCIETLNPDIILFDEVLGAGGDEEYNRKGKERIENLLKSGKTMIIVSHKLDSLDEYTDRVMWLHKGKIRAMGDPDKIIKDYIEFSDALK